MEKGFEYEGIWITDPTVSECGRFEVDPITYYGLTQEQVEESCYEYKRVYCTGDCRHQ